MYRTGPLAAALLASVLTGIPASSGAWEPGTYRDFVPIGSASPMDDEATARSVGPAMKLGAASVHRPRLRPGEEASLRAQYTVIAPGAALEIKETRVISYNGSVVTSVQRVVARSSGRVGSEYRLRVPRDAAEGWYTATTIIETARPIRSAVAPDRKTTPFYIEAAPAVERPTSPLALPEHPEGRVVLRLWSDKSGYRVGDSVRLHFEANRDGYLTLVNVGTSGKITVLFPNRFSGGNQVKTGSTYSVPAADDSYELTLSEPPGIELVYGVLTSKQVNFIEADFARVGGIFKSPDNLEVFTRDINVGAKQVPRAERATAVLELEVTP